MSITVKDVEYVAELSALSLSAAEKEQYTQSLNAILDYMEQLQELDTDGIIPTTHVLPLENVFRDDIVQPCLSREKVLMNAPAHTTDSFKVPKIL